MTTRWTGARLQREAVDALGRHADPRARDLLAHATLSIEPAVLRWESSRGPMRAHRVHLSVDAARLGTLRHSPALEDALRAALAAAISREPGETLHELVVSWSPAGGAGPYRDSSPAARSESDGMRDALVQYLLGAEETALAEAVGGAEVRFASGSQPPELRVRLGPADASRASRAPLDPRGLAAIARALRDLVGDDGARVVVSAF